MVKRFAVAAVVIAAAACSSARSTKITETNKDSVLKDIKDSRDFTVEEIGLLMYRQIRVAAAGALHQTPPGWVGMTLQEVIDDERKVQKDADAKKDEADRLAAETKAKEDAAADELRKTLVLSAYEKGFKPADPMSGSFDSYITLKYAYENKSAKDIRAFRGSVRFTDLFLGGHPNPATDGHLKTGHHDGAAETLTPTGTVWSTRGHEQRLDRAAATRHSGAGTAGLVAPTD